MFGSRTEGTMLAPWLQALQASDAGPEITLVRSGRYRALPEGIACPGCRTLVRSDLDHRVLRLLPQAGDLREGDAARVWVADGRGQVVLRADLSDTGRARELANAFAPRPAHP